MLATVDNPKPTYQKSKVTVTGRLLLDGKPVTGAKMTTTWHFKTKTEQCTGNNLTDSNGSANCTVDTKDAYRNYTIEIDVTMSYGSQNYSNKISVTTQD